MKIASLFILFVMLTTMSFGQSELTPPSSPESQGLLRSLNIKVNKGTGTAGVSIPLYTIAAAENVNIPIVLSYTCSGIKVQDLASWVGLGWNLSVGGKITRVIVDNDDLVNGYCRGSGILANNFSSWWGTTNLLRERVDHCTSKSSCTGCVTFDGEPDLYYYEIPGRTGMFTIDQDGKAWTIPYTPVNIVLDNDLNFTITDELGVKYIFNLKESTEVTRYSEVKHNSVNSITRSHISTWHLTKIKPLSGNEVSFDYLRGGEISYSNYNYYRKNNDPIIDKSIQYRSSPYYLQYITWGNGKLSFTSQAGGHELPNGRQLNEITIVSNLEYLKSIKFLYSYFQSTSGYKRLKLIEVDESNSTSKLMLGKFEYNTSRNLPARDSKDFDHWGYYNGKSNTTFFPTEGADRSPSFAHTTANILTRVYNNLGGYVDYEYENNKLINGSIVGGVRVKNIKRYDGAGNCLTTNYSYANGSGVIIYSNNDYTDNWNTGGKFCYLHDDKNTSVYYSTVTETLSNGSKIVSSYTDLMDGPDEPSMRHINRIESEGISNDAPTVFPNSSRFWRRGLLKEEIQYSSTRQEVKRVQYKYEFKKHVRKEIKGYYVHEYNMPTGALLSNLIVYSWLSEPIYVDSVRITGVDIPTTVTKYTYDPTYYLPVEEKVVYDRGDTYRVKTKYPFSFQAQGNLSGIVESNTLDALLQARVLAKPIERIKIKNDKVIEGKLLLYKLVSNDKNERLPVLAKSKTLASVPIDTTDFSMSGINSSKNFYHDNRYTLVDYYDHYDGRLNLTSFHKDQGSAESMIYGYNFSLPVAMVKNAVYHPRSTTRENQVFYTSFEDETSATILKTAKTGNKVYSQSYTINLSNFKPGSYILSYWKKSGEKWELVEQELTVASSTASHTIYSSSYPIDEVRIMPRNAMMTTYTCIPGVGLTSEMDTNGNTMYYEYDVFGRLLRVLDDDRKVVKGYEYFIKPF